LRINDFHLLLPSTQAGTVAVVQYRLILGKREHSAPTDGPICSPLDSLAGKVAQVTPKVVPKAKVTTGQ
jgi:hypothetical protein